MKNKNLPLYIAACVLFVLVVGVVILRPGAVKVGVKELGVEHIDAAGMTRLEVSIPAKADPKAEGEAAAPRPRSIVVLEKQASGWRVFDKASPVTSFPVDDGLLKSTLDAVKEFAPTDQVASKKSRLGAFDIDDDSGLFVTFTSAGKDVALVFGRAPKGGSGSTVRKQGGEDVFVAKGRLSSLLRKDVAGWRRRALLDLKTEDITEVSVKPAEGSAFTVVARSEPAPAPTEPEGNDPAAKAPEAAPRITWSLGSPETLPAGFRLDDGAVGRVASSLVGLRASDFADGVSDADAGLVDAHTVITCKTKDGASRSVHLGKEDDKKRVFARVDGDAQIYLLATYSARNAGKSLEELRDLAVLTGGADDVAKVTWRAASGTVVVERTDGEWKRVEPKAAPTTFDDEQMGPQVTALMRTRAVRIAPAGTTAASTGVDKATTSVEVKFKNGQTQRLQFGAPVPASAEEDANSKDAGKAPKEFFARGGDGTLYVVGAFAKTRFDAPTELFKKPPPPPQMGPGGGLGGMQGLDSLPPDVRKKLEASLRNAQTP